MPVERIGAANRPDIHPPVAGGPPESAEGASAAHVPDRVSGHYTPTARTTPTRDRHRARYEREVVHPILDAAFVCHLGFVADGEPVVLPTIYARVGERLYIHGSTGSRPLRSAAPHSGDPGLRVCVTVTLVDGIVLARSAFHHSVNYRSVMAHGIAYQVTDPDERSVALDALVDHAVPGRADDSRRPDAKELAATAVLRLDLREVSAKLRSGGPAEEPEEDLTLPHWAGVLPVRSVFDAPVPAADLDPAIPLPDYLAARG